MSGGRRYDSQMSGLHSRRIKMMYDLLNISNNSPFTQERGQLVLSSVYSLLKANGLTVTQPGEKRNFKTKHKANSSRIFASSDSQS